MEPSILIPLGGMLTSIIGTIAISWAVVSVIRIRTQARVGPSELARAVADLEERLDLLQQQLAEAQERIDFTERLLTRGQASPEGTS